MRRYLLPEDDAAGTVEYLHGDMPPVIYRQRYAASSLRRCAASSSPRRCIVALSLQRRCRGISSLRRCTATLYISVWTYRRRHAARITLRHRLRADVLRHLLRGDDVVARLHGDTPPAIHRRRYTARDIAASSPRRCVAASSPRRCSSPSDDGALRGT